jgi:hypothetical protein
VAASLFFATSSFDETQAHYVTPLRLTCDYVCLTRPSAMLRALLTHPETITLLTQGNPTQRRWSLVWRCHQRHVQQTQFPDLGSSHVKWDCCVCECYTHNKLHRRKLVIITPALYSEGLVFDSRSRSRLI